MNVAAVGNLDCLYDLAVTSLRVAKVVLIQDIKATFLV